MQLQNFIYFRCKILLKLTQVFSNCTIEHTCCTYCKLVLFDLLICFLTYFNTFIKFYFFQIRNIFWNDTGVSNCTIVHTPVLLTTCKLYIVVQSCTRLYKAVHCCKEAKFQLDDTRTHGHTHTQTLGLVELRLRS